MFFRILILDKKILSTDVYDVRHLVYLKDLDLLVSNDEGMRDTAQLAYDGRKSTMSLSEFAKSHQGR